MPPVYTGPGSLSFFAGTGYAGSPIPGPATASHVDAPTGIAVDAAGNTFIADEYNNVIDKVAPDGTLSVFAGNDDPDAAGYSPTPGPATKSALDPRGIAVDTKGNLYVADGEHGRVEKIDPAGNLTFFAGGGDYETGTATNCDIGTPTGVAVDPAGDVYIVDANDYVVDKVTPDGNLTIVAGQFDQFYPPQPGPATGTSLGVPEGVAADNQGNIYVSDNYDDEVLKVTSGGTLSILVGTGQAGTPTPGPANQSAMNGSDGLALDNAGNLFVADPGNNEIEKVDTSGNLSIVAGTGQQGAPLPGRATSSPLSSPDGVGVDSQGDFYIADFNNAFVEKVKA